jgi:hypothetical protein
VEVGLLAVLRGRVELRPQVLELLHARATIVSAKNQTKNRGQHQHDHSSRETRIFARRSRREEENRIKGTVLRDHWDPGVKAANLERLDEALAALHGRLVDSGGRSARVPPGRLVLLHSLLTIRCCSAGIRGNGGRKPRCQGKWEGSKEHDALSLSGSRCSAASEQVYWRMVTPRACVPVCCWGGGGRRGWRWAPGWRRGGGCRINFSVVSGCKVRLVQSKLGCRVWDDGGGGGFLMSFSEV